MWLVLAVVAAVLWQRPWIVVWIAAAVVVADLGSYGLREAIGRPRPSVLNPHPEPLVHTPHSGSFPSGHATIAFACATVLTAEKPRWAVPLFLLAGAIAFSRVYVGVHYPLDVLGGAALGVLIGLALRVLRPLEGARRRSRPAPR